MNRRLYKFSEGVNIFQERTYCFSPNILSEATIERHYAKQLFGIYGEKPWIIRLKDVYIQILVLPTFDKNQGLTILKKHQEEIN